jgi:hypothetical protein
MKPKDKRSTRQQKLGTRVYTERRPTGTLRRVKHDVEDRGTGETN